MLLHIWMSLSSTAVNFTTIYVHNMEILWKDGMFGMFWCPSGKLSLLSGNRPFKSKDNLVSYWLIPTVPQARPLLICSHPQWNPSPPPPLLWLNAFFALCPCLPFLSQKILYPFFSTSKYCYNDLRTLSVTCLLFYETLSLQHLHLNLMLQSGLLQGIGLSF